MNTLTNTLEIFLKYIVTIPINLKNTALGLLCIFTVIDITLQVFNLEEIDWNKYIVKKTFKVGIIIFLISKWNWIITEILKGFIKIGDIGLKVSDVPNKFINNPSRLIDIAFDLTSKIMEKGSWTEIVMLMFLGLISLFLIIGFCFLGFAIVITTIEFYLLTGLAIIFLPFGTLKMGENYYTNVFKLVVGCAIKMCVLNLVILISQPLILELKDKVLKNESNVSAFLHIAAVILILAYIALQIPSMAASMLTGSPTMSASAALQTGLAGVRTAVGGLGMAITGAVAAGGAYSGAMKGAAAGMDKGGMAGAGIGGTLGSLAGPGGVAFGQKVGGAFGSVVGAAAGATGGAAKGAYSNLNKPKAGNTKNNNANTGASATSSNTQGNTVNTDTGASATSSNTQGNTVNTDTGASATSSNTQENTVNTDTGASATSGNTQGNTVNTDTGASATSGNTQGNTVNTDTGASATSSNTQGNTVNTDTGASATSSNTQGNTVNTDTGINKNYEKVIKKKTLLNGEEI